tara:strand:+ start:434 stop:892 length:459 start_codon:yes stop_codon:yes gene_type:complete
MENLVNSPRYFDDLTVGEEFVSRWYEATEKELIEFATKYDYQYFHIDSERAKLSPFGGIIASGTYTFAIWNKLNLEVNGDIAWIAGMGFDEFRFPKPLRPGVQFRSESKLIDKKVSKSSKDRGIVTHLYKLVTKDGDELFTSLCPALVHKKE